jgi:MurNAc alpha-1-phosphate uridylyltransferase
MLPLVLLAGGMATRLGELTETTPKSLIEIAGRPFIEYQLKSFASAGFSQIVVCVGNLSEKIINFVGDGSQYGLQVRYSFDGDEQLGTGGAIRKALPFLENNFFVQYGDSFLKFNYQELEREFNKNPDPCLMTIYENHNSFDKSNVEIFEGKRISYSKSSPSPEMNFIDYGCMILDGKLFGDFKTPTKFDLSYYLEHLSRRGLLSGFQVQKRFFEIGSLQGIQVFDEYVRSHPHEF